MAEQTEPRPRLKGDAYQLMIRPPGSSAEKTPQQALPLETGCAAGMMVTDSGMIDGY
jgi:hypothetical protein